MLNGKWMEKLSKIEPVAHGGNWREAVRRQDKAPDEMLDFSLNINPLGPPPAVLQCLKWNLTAIQRYPDPESRDVKIALAHYLKVSPENVLVGNGAMEILHWLLPLLRPRQVLVCEPTFGEYRRIAQLNGAAVTTLFLRPQDAFLPQPGAILAKLGSAELIFLCRPNNPTGGLIPKNILDEVLELAEHKGVFLVIDESFLDFLPDWQQHTLCGRAVVQDNMLVLRSLTKLFALPGLRLGAAVANAVLVRAMDKLRDPWNVNILAQLAGTVALQQEDYLEQSRSLIRQERDFLHTGLVALCLHPFPAVANFVLVDIGPTGPEAYRLTAEAAQRGLLLRDCSAFPGLGPHYIRLAVKDRSANQKLLQVLAEILNNYKHKK